jgi:hypothetical protein
MGLEFKIIEAQKKELDRVVCDRCQKEIRKDSEGHWNEFGEPYTQYHEPAFDDFFLLDHCWGYSSGKDGEHHKAVLCEPCYDEVFKHVKIQITRCF